MKKILFITIILFTISGYVISQPIFIPKTGKEEPYYKNKWFFGISLTTTYSGFVKYGFVKIHEDGREEITWLTQKNFIMQVTGQQPSKANPNKENLLEKYEIKWDTFQELWKIRYQEYPYETTETMPPGWAGKMSIPTDAQWAFLKQNYNYSALTQFLHGENLWKLLKDMQDPNWVAQYSSLK